jgi:hypothetical protein
LPYIWLTELSGVESQQDKIVAIAKINTHEREWSLEFISPSFNANGFGR